MENLLEHFSYEKFSCENLDQCQMWYCLPCQCRGQPRSTVTFNTKREFVLKQPDFHFNLFSSKHKTLQATRSSCSMKSTKNTRTTTLASDHSQTRIGWLLSARFARCTSSSSFANKRLSSIVQLMIMTGLIFIKLVLINKK